MGLSDMTICFDLIKIGKVGLVDQNKEFERIIKESELSRKGELEKF